MSSALMTCSSIAAAVLILAGCGGEPTASDTPDDPGGPGSATTPAIADSPSDAGADFRAIGQEPGWIMDVFEGDRIRLSYQYGTKEAVLPFPRTLGGPRPFEAQAQSGGDRLSLRVSDQACTDPMNGQRYDWTVSVTINDTDLSGCGEWL